MAGARPSAWESTRHRPPAPTSPAPSRLLAAQGTAPGAPPPTCLARTRAARGRGSERRRTFLQPQGCRWRTTPVVTPSTRWGGLPARLRLQPLFVSCRMRVEVLLPSAAPKACGGECRAAHTECRAAWCVDPGACCPAARLPCCPTDARDLRMPRSCAAAAPIGAVPADTALPDWPPPLQLGGTDRIPPGGSAFLDREAVLRRQEGRP